MCIRDRTNISPWRRAICGDLTSIFDFATPDDADRLRGLPATADRAAQAAALPGTITPPAPDKPGLARQQAGTRPSRALPYALSMQVRADGDGIALRFDNTGTAGAVLHVYDRLHLEAGPRRYTVEAGKQLEGVWPTTADQGRYDLWVLGPNGFHRHVAGRQQAGAAPLTVEALCEAAGPRLRLTLRNPGGQARVCLLYTSDAADE